MRIALALLTVAALHGCKKGERPLTISLGAAAPVIDGDRSDCPMRMTIAPAAPPREQAPIWEATAPLPIASDGPCPMPFPIAYGEVPPAIRAYPERAPALEKGRLYSVHVEGVAADHVGRFRAS